MVRQLQLTVIAALLVLAGLPAPAAARPRTTAGTRSTLTLYRRKFATLSRPTPAYVAGRWRLNTRSRDIFKTAP
jgi:hypothetical protein